MRAAPRPLAAAGSRAASPSFAPGAAPGITGRCKRDLGAKKGRFTKAISPGLWDPARGACKGNRPQAPGSRPLEPEKGRPAKAIDPGLPAAGNREGAFYKDDRPGARGTWDPGRGTLQRRSVPSSGQLGLEKGTVAFPAPEPTETSRTTLGARVTFRGRCHPHSQGPGAVEGLGAGAGCAGLIHTSHTPPPKSTARRPSEPHTEPCTGILRSLW